MIESLQQEMDSQAHKALLIKKKLKPVEGLADEDTKEIEEANQIRLRAISAIQTLLFLKISSLAVRRISCSISTSILSSR